MLLEIGNLKLVLGGKPIIDDLSLGVEEAELHAVLGVNGTGKTTLAYLIMGVNYFPDEGKIIFDGEDITRYSISQRAKRGITMAWQEPARFEGLTIKEYVELGNRKAKAEECLGMVGLSPDYLAKGVDVKLSGGERKRVELASVLAQRPKLAILDEIDSGIDVVSLPYIREEIRSMCKQGSSVLLITHSEETASVADRASLICGGKVLKMGRPGEVSKFFRERCRPCDHVSQIDWDKVGSE